MNADGAWNVRAAAPVKTTSTYWLGHFPARAEFCLWGQKLKPYTRQDLCWEWTGRNAHHVAGVKVRSTRCCLILVGQINTH
jgi:hypothetical protein